MSTLRKALLAAVAAAAGAALAPRADAGGSPETTLVVVNEDSPASLRLAREWARMRRLPPTNLCFVKGVPTLFVIGVDDFRERIWKPVREHLEAHGLSERIDCIAYSADFPYGVDFAADKAPPYAAPLSAIASLTSMTYLARRVEARAADEYLHLEVNGYYRRESAVRRVLSRRVIDLYNDACAKAKEGKADEAMATLARAVDAGWLDVAHTQADPDLESLHGRADFAELLDRMTEIRASRPDDATAPQPSRGFASRWAWTGEDEPVRDAPADSPDRYRLSTMLAYTGERGNSVPEALSYLDAAARSDGTRPDGTVYLLLNGDVRATTRQPFFGGTVAALRDLGRKAEVLEKDGTQTGVLPVGKDDVLGAVVGIADFDWAKSGSRLLPGAIAEHLTSCGAQFNTAGQTKLSAFLRAGAAGSSGAVAEPYALHWKFPNPSVHVHYARGCSLAESFYQSVWGPYQLLVVGDPLARPFAEFAKVTLAAPSVAVPCAGTVDVVANVEAAKPPASLELWVDGAFVAEGRPGEPLRWDTTRAEDGAHDLRVVAVEDSLVATRSFAAARVAVANGKRAVTIAASAKAPPAYGDALALSGRAPGAREVEVLDGFRVVATAPVRGDAWKATVPTERLGMGPVTLQARAAFKEDHARSEFLDLLVGPPEVRRPPKSKPAGRGKPAPAAKPGLRVALERAKQTEEVEVTTLAGEGGDTFRKQVEAKAKGAWSKARVSGEFEVPAAGLYQFVIRTSAAVTLSVDGEPALATAKPERAQASYALVSLSEGWHTIDLTLEGGLDLHVLLSGDQVASPPSGKSLRH